MEECVDGEYQDFKSKDGAYVRKNFFGRHPETAALVEDWTDDEIWALIRGGHDVHKVYAAYKAAVEHKGQPTIILAKTIKGYGMGTAGEGQMIAHQAKKLGHDALRAFRDRFQIPFQELVISGLAGGGIRNVFERHVSLCIDSNRRRTRRLRRVSRDMEPRPYGAKPPAAAVTQPDVRGLLR